MKKSLLYIAAAALSSVALGACDDDMALPPIAEPESEWVGQENTTVEQVTTEYWQDANNYNTPVNLNASDEEIIIKGRVISSDATRNIYNNIVVLGEDGYALTIAARTESSSKTLSDQYPFGSEVYLNLSGLSVGRYAGLFQVGAPSGTEITFLTNAVLVEHLQANSIGYPDLVKPLEVDIATLTAAKSNTEEMRKYMSQLIRIDGVTFQNAGKPFAATATQNQYVTDATGARINVRCHNRATWHNDIIPGGPGAVVGILSYFNNDWQILMNDAATDLIGFDPSATPGPAPAVDPEGDGTAASPYNVAAALKAIAEGPATTDVYVKGIITNLSIDTSYGNATYDLVDAIGGESVKIYRGYWFDGDRFTSTDQMENGKEVVVCGVLENYMGNTPEMKQGNKVISYDGKTSGSGSENPTPGADPQGDGTQASPYNVAKALAEAKALAADATTDTEVYIKGKISAIKEIETANFGNATYSIVDVDGAEAMTVYRGYWFDGAQFTPWARKLWCWASSSISRATLPKWHRAARW